MANTKSARKAARVTERRHSYRRPVLSALRTSIRKARERIAAGGGDEARQAVIAAVSALDRAAGKGVVHPNNAARRKSRLMRHLNAALASV